MILLVMTLIAFSTSVFAAGEQITPDSLTATYMVIMMVVYQIKLDK